MKKTLLIIIVLIVSCSSTKTNDIKPSNTKYSLSELRVIHKDLLNHQDRQFSLDVGNTGEIENRHILDSILSLATNKTIDSSKNLLVFYYPGIDKCNSSGAATRKSLNKSFNEIESCIHNIDECNILYLYKEDIGLKERNDGYKTWFRDPERTFETLFFEKHPFCHGYVIITKKGKYYKKGGEFNKDVICKKFKSIISEI